MKDHKFSTELSWISSLTIQSKTGALTADPGCTKRFAHSLLSQSKILCRRPPFRVLSYPLKLFFFAQEKQVTRYIVHGCHSPDAFPRPGVPYSCNTGLLQNTPPGWGSRCFATAACDFFALISQIPVHVSKNKEMVKEGLFFSAATFCTR